MKSTNCFGDNVKNFDESENDKGIEFEKSKTESASEQNDAIGKAIGSFGKWQILIVFLLFLAKFPVAFHQMSIIFLAPPANYNCELSDAPSNMSSSQTPIPITTFNMECSSSCKNHIYDRSIFQETIVTEWDLVCDRLWLKDFTQTIFMFGILVGNLVFGHLADRYGRFPPLMAAVILQLVSGVITSFATDWYTFTTFRFFLANATGGTIVITFVIIMEIVGTEHREVAGTLFQLPFNIGHLLLAVIGYYVRDWHSFQLAISLPSILLLSYYWFVLESPRWLMTSGKTDKAIETMEKIAKINNLPTATIKDDMQTMAADMASTSNTRGSFLDLFRTSGLWVKTLCISFNWLVCGLCLFGVSHYVGQISGDIFWNVAISAIAQIPGTLVAIVLNKKFGRKVTLIIGNCLTGVSCLAIAVVPAIPMVRVLLAALGILGVSISFPTAYLYAGEVFPTVVRNSGVGFCSMVARIGSMAAPFVAGLSSVQFWIPPIVFGVFPILGAALCLLLPETRGKKLSNTLQDSQDANREDCNSAA